MTWLQPSVRSLPFTEARSPSRMAMWPLLAVACEAMNLQEFWPYATLSARMIMKTWPLLGAVIVGDQRPEQRGVVLSRELFLIRDVVGPEVGIVEGQRNTELEVRARCELTS